MSVDTEGGEMELLEAFDFGAIPVRFLLVEIRVHTLVGETPEEADAAERRFGRFLAAMDKVRRARGPRCLGIHQLLKHLGRVSSWS